MGYLPWHKFLLLSLPGYHETTCLVSGVQTTRFLSKYVRNIYLTTKIRHADKLFNTYDKIYKYEQLSSGEIKCDIMIRLIYELSDNHKTYIQGYMESIGFGDVNIKKSPLLRDDWKKIINDNYILIAPCTSSWEESKRNWGYDKFIELSKLLEAEYNTKCIILEKKYSSLQQKYSNVSQYKSVKH